MPEIAVQIPQIPAERKRIVPQKNHDLPGQIFGRWQVQDAYEVTPKGEKKWLCRCTCGTQRYVLERSLRHGGSLSCGCLRREALSEALAHDITGQTFGELTALERSSAPHKNGGIWWRCRCTCGNSCEVPATLLVKGRKSHCGCMAGEKNYAFSDITGRRFGRLVAQYRTEKRSGRGGIVWHCRCDCGSETEVAYSTLMYSSQQSCGCRKKEHDRRLNTLQTRVDGTSLEIISSKKIPKNSSTGIRGVYLIRGKYVAKVNFQKKAYYLGTYDTIEQAREARQEAEEGIYQPTLEYHARWKEKAEQDPEWAEKNPMQIFVTRERDRLKVTFLPRLEG